MICRLSLYTSDVERKFYCIILYHIGFLQLFLQPCNLILEQLNGLSESPEIFTV